MALVFAAAAITTAVVVHRRRHRSDPYDDSTSVFSFSEKRHNREARQIEREIARQEERQGHRSSRGRLASVIDHLKPSSHRHPDRNEAPPYTQYPMASPNAAQPVTPVQN